MGKHLINKRNKDMWYLFLMPLFFAILPLLVVQRETDRELRELALLQLQDAAVQQQVTIAARLDGEYAMLEGLAAHIARLEEDNAVPEEIMHMLSDFCSASEFYMIGFSDPTGFAILSTGYTTDIADRCYFQQSITGARAIEWIKVSALNGYQRIIVSVPVYQSQKIIGVLHGSFEPEIFSTLLETAMFQNNVDTYLCNAQGELIASTVSKDEAVLMRESLSSQTAAYPFAQRIQSALGSGEPDTMRCQISGQHYDIAVSPLTVNHAWSIVNIVPESVVTAQSATLRNTLWIGMGGALLGMALTVAYLLYHERKRNKQLQQEKELLRQSEKSYALVNALSDSVLFFGDLRQDTFTFNENFKDIFGYAPFCNKISQLNVNNPHVLAEDMDKYYRLGQQITDGKLRAHTEFRVIDASGNPRWQRAEYMTVEDENGTPTRVIGKLSNIDEQKSDMALLQQMAERDSLTKLTNRGNMQLQTDHFLEEAESNGTHAFLMLDVDDFKAVNDSCGHQCGDAVLRAYAARMQSIFRKTDILGRMGGDEFAVFVKNIGSVERIEKKAAMLCSQMNLQDAAGVKFSATCSVGIAISNSTSVNFEKLYHCADTALYRAKQAGKNNFALCVLTDE